MTDPSPEIRLVASLDALKYRFYDLPELMYAAREAPPAARLIPQSLAMQAVALGPERGRVELRSRLTLPGGFDATIVYALRAHPAPATQRLLLSLVRSPVKNVRYVSAAALSDYAAPLEAYGPVPSEVQRDLDSGSEERERSAAEALRLNKAPWAAPLIQRALHLPDPYVRFAFVPGAP